MGNDRALAAQSRSWKKKKIKIKTSWKLRRTPTLMPISAIFKESDEHEGASPRSVDTSPG